MAFVEVAEKRGNTYYHVSASHRLPGGGWKKLRKYFGKAKPTKAQVIAAEKELHEELFWD